MKVLCKHCTSSCKKIGQIECKDYLPIAGKYERLKKSIREAYKNGNYDLAKKIQKQIDENYF